MSSEDGLYGGVNIKSLILDIGHLNYRFGYSGELSPSIISPSFFSPAQPHSIPDPEPKSKKPKTNNSYSFEFNSPQRSISPSSLFTHNNSLNLEVFPSLFSASKEKISPSPSSNSNSEEEIKEGIKEEIKEPVLFSDYSSATLKERSQLSEILFEEKGVPGLYFSNKSSLSAYSSGRTTALIVDMGHAETRVTPVVDGFPLVSAEICTNIAGAYVDSRFEDAIIASNPSLSIGTSGTKYFESDYCKSEFIKNIKRDKILHINNNSNSNLEGEGEGDDLVEYSFPDGTSFQISKKETGSIFESFFSELTSVSNYNGEKGEKSYQGLHVMSVFSISETDVEARKDLYGNVVLCGGGANVKGIEEAFVEKIEDSLSELSSVIKVKVNKGDYEEEVENSVWIGGSILSSLGSFQKMWVAKSEWEEIGSKAIDKRCY